MRTLILAVGLAVGVLASGLFAWDANAITTINILDIGYSGATTDGTLFVADPNPTLPSTGTGVFQPFLRIGVGNGALVYGHGLELGFNTEAKDPNINFDTKDGSNWTRSVLFGELGTINGYYGLSLDANQTSCPTCTNNRITITDMQIYIGSDSNLANPEATNTGVNGTGYTGTVFNSSDNGLLGLPPVWTLDNTTNGDVSVILQASICDSNGQCGSGHGDLGVLIPQNLLSGSPTDYFVLYTEYSGANDGFEEWRFFDGPTQVPEPASLLLIGSGLLSLGVWGMRRKKG